MIEYLEHSPMPANTLFSGGREQRNQSHVAACVVERFLEFIKVDVVQRLRLHWQAHEKDEQQT